jgi:hypothetical protein
VPTTRLNRTGDVSVCCTDVTLDDIKKLTDAVDAVDVRSARSPVS